jgi:hypothetical protein
MIYIIILAIIAAFLFWVSRRPDDFKVERQIAINATAAEVFPWINNLKKMNQWNPWAGQDAKSAINYEGPEAGAGAVYTWAGGKMGQGRFTILDSKPTTEVNCRLQIFKPMTADNSVNFRLLEGGGNVIVVWPMSGKNTFFNKLFQTFFSMDKMVGKDFEKGLATLKALVEQKKLH